MTDSQRAEAMRDLRGWLDLMGRKAELRAHFHAGAMAVLNALNETDDLEEQGEIITALQNRYVDENA